MFDKNMFTNFGFKKVQVSEKTQMVKDVFNSVADKYDLMNDAMSLGVHRYWKATFVDLINPKITKSLLDVGGGSGDIAFRFLEKGGTNVTVLDINQHMLKVCQKRASEKGYMSSLHFVGANAEELPIVDNNMEAYSIAFCLRNVTDIKLALTEAYRVLKPRSKFYCLEFSKVQDNHMLAQMYDMWSKYMIPNMGKFIAKDVDSYNYLVESIKLFYTQEELQQLMQEVGFKNVYYRNLTSGIACIHVGEK